ncbi:hypothetical protein LTR56_007677 [Elasticomyces elasticus]|nr:hypothetical protein LTR56_007677 [Elasticomyces elasticus]KAK3661951.1 hypothetical protein LTR22_007325 [Elasticomyces elasticus]KAK4925536.1 hypothetical protein LTR49_007374 [Elasticomyces elasticus]KAK5759814.1 hypothetical protein LTS12_010001 [Elasticomyces elasticus]
MDNEGPASYGKRLALHQAAADGDASAVRTLLDEGVAINDMEDGFSGTPLIEAAGFGREAVVCLLLSRKADIDAFDMEGDDALASAAYWGHANIVCLLLDAGAVLGRVGPSSLSALWYAVAREHDSVIKLLLSRTTAPQNVLAVDNAPTMIDDTSKALETVAQCNLLFEVEKAQGSLVLWDKFGRESWRDRIRLVVKSSETL